MPTDDVNASSSDAPEAQQDIPELTDEVITSHPKYKELEEKHAAARQGMDKSNLSKKELQAEVARLKVLAGEESIAPAGETVTKSELESKLWELQNKNDIEIYGDEEYAKDIESGIPKDYALKTAKLRYQSNPDKARLDRQQSMASGPAIGTRNLESDEITEADRRGMAQFGYSEEAVRIQKRLKRERGQL